MSNFLKKYGFVIAFPVIAICSSFQQIKHCKSRPGASLKIVFINTVKGSRIVLNDSVYTNPFNEKYNISKLKYYVTNIELIKTRDVVKEKNSYHLIDENDSASLIINLSVPSGNYSGIKFLLGVDSLHNVSGAQTDDLDPAKDMFWTWNSGYVMAKMEGNSTASSLVNHKFEYHIGSFSGPFNVLKNIDLSFPLHAVQLNAGRDYTIIIYADMNTWWQSVHDIKIAEHPAITSPGINAKNMSDNYAHMFRIEKIITQ